MLSNYLKSNKAHFSPHLQHITLNYAEEQLHIDILDRQYSQIRALTLTHCGLKSLKGIEQFQQLEDLNVRFNSLTEVSQLYRIQNKELIHRLEFTGNDIEYYGAALFINLVQIFPNLIELNGKNYFSIIYKNSGKHNQMKKIVAQSHRLQKEMLKTIRKADLQTKEHKRSTDIKSLKTQNNYYPTHTDEEGETSKSPSKSKELECTSKKQRSIRYSPHQEEEVSKENLNNSNQQQEYDVSLGDISNIPMTKSIRGSYNITNSQLKQNKKKGLQIFTLNESMQGNKMPLSQPTATFAMQREKQNVETNGNFMFKNKEKAQKYKISAMPIEQYGYESKEEYERPTKRETYQSVSDDLNQSWGSSFTDDNLIHEEKTNNDFKKNKFAEALFLKNLMFKVFSSWRNLPCERNFPMRSQFL